MMRYFGKTDRRLALARAWARGGRRRRQAWCRRRCGLAASCRTNTRRSE